jgi:hypothetical protein
MSRLPSGLLVLCLLTVTVGADAPPARPPHAEDLRHECDALISQVVKRQYGWGWPTELPVSSDKTPHQREPTVALEPLHTPAAALLLLHASEVLDDSNYADAAKNVARLVAASVQTSGQIPSHVALGPKPLNRERPRPLPDRASTRAGVALLLSIIPGKEVDLNRDELLTRAAGRGAAWLAKHQAPTGAWPVAYPPGADAKDVTRLVRFDTPDTRDNLLAMLLAYEVLGEASHRRAIERSMAYLMRVRNGEAQSSGAAMYGPAFDAGGGAIEKFDEFPPFSTDALASRYGIQAVFAAYVVMGPKEWSHSATVATTAAGELPVPEPGKWHRWYSSKGDVIEPESLKPQIKPVGFADAVVNPFIGDWGLPQTLAVVKAHDDIGRDKFLQRLKASFTLSQRLALTLCGLVDEPMAPEFPTSLPEARAYLARAQSESREGPATRPTELPQRLRTVWRLIVRAKIEKQFGI